MEAAESMGGRSTKENRRKNKVQSRDKRLTIGLTVHAPALLNVSRSKCQPKNVSMTRPGTEVGKEGFRIQKTIIVHLIQIIKDILIHKVSFSLNVANFINGTKVDVCS